MHLSYARLTMLFPKNKTIVIEFHSNKLPIVILANLANVYANFLSNHMHFIQDVPYLKVGNAKKSNKRDKTD
jgi:hypothetical protein